MGADSFGIDRGFNSAIIQPRFDCELALIVGRSGHDRVAIELRSNRDRESRSWSNLNPHHLMNLEEV